MSEPTSQPQTFVEETEVSYLRLLLVLVIFGGLVFAIARWSINKVAEARDTPSSTWFAPYVDVTLTPTLHFEDSAEQLADDIVLGFIVAGPGEGCTPTWGSYYDLEAAARALDLDRRVVRLRERGGDVIVSFGGAINNELAITCTDVEQLTAAYQGVIDRYDLTALDFDIEGASLNDVAANTRRAQAIAKLQEANEDLDVWFTLPVDPEGLRSESVALLDNALEAGVEIAGVNVMTMNYGGSRASTVSMKDATISALNATWQQLDGVYRRHNQVLTERELWQRIGITPMIGQNDVPADVFTTADARAIVQYAEQVDAGRLSFWSANRDVQCGAVVDDARVSNTCSGVSQSPLEFSRIFSDAAPSRRSEIEDAAPSTDLPSDGLTRDDPLTSPYPLWRTAKAYTEDAKVTWQGRVYQAKWWTQGDQPDAPVKNTWETPWRYLGPVLASDREALLSDKKTVTGIRPRWLGEKVYVLGDEVEVNGQAFRAKWWTQGNMPEIDPDQPYDHPWLYLGEIVKETGTPSSIPAAPSPSTTPSPSPATSVTTSPTAEAAVSASATAVAATAVMTTTSQSIVAPTPAPVGVIEYEEPAPTPTEAPQATPEPVVVLPTAVPTAPPATPTATAVATQPAPAATPTPTRHPSGTGANPG